MTQIDELYEEKHNKLNRSLTKIEKEEVAYRVYDKIEEKEIWIPFSVIKDKCFKKIGKLDKKIHNNI